ncbi:N-acetyltransferase [Cryobacterium lactosi]|uniref:N-acetyltransferase n=1 Tax=Cryobacterium lactosi TaxID=1259202 RepID=A0A4R9BJA0_9MICO|nr:GNAT family protein [Cryobacterium lactosi]TFD85849.1 N-acetyltransferase [Cryobacterium lactosi]
MPADLWPLLDLRLTTSRLVLRCPTDDELAALADLAAAGVHNPGERPYLTPWTEGTPQQTAVHVVQQHRSRRGDWSPDSWALDLGLFCDDRPVGMVALRGREFPIRREVKTESWLGLAHHRQGLGTEARSALLHLAFAGLGAHSALTEVFQDNAGMQGVSRRLGYRHDGISRDVRDGQFLISDRLRLNRDDWFATDRMRVDITGLAPCLPSFGL